MDLWNLVVAIVGVVVSALVALLTTRATSKASREATEQAKSAAAGANAAASRTAEALERMANTAAPWSVGHSKKGRVQLTNTSELDARDVELENGGSIVRLGIDGDLSIVHKGASVRITATRAWGVNANKPDLTVTWVTDGGVGRQTWSTALPR